MSRYKSKYTGLEIDAHLDRARGVSNPNLLDNWYFGNPVNQRGQTSYTGAGYGIDRWFTVGNNSKVLINNAYIEFTSQAINGYLAQKLESKSYAGKTITLSAIVKVTQNCGLHAVCYNSAGTTISDSFTTLYPSSDFQLVQHTIDVPNSSAVLQCDFITLAEGKTSITVKAAKLELGSQQTLAHQDENGNWQLNEIPDYGEQLLRCIQSTADFGDGYANKVILHTGNKPSGSYTGNGSATKRTIDTGGTGDICLVYGFTYASIVTPYGTLSRYYNDDTPVNLKMSQMSFEKGVLTIATDSAVCNYNTATYYYQVL